MSDERPKRQQTQTERDLEGLAARRERVRSAPFGVPVDFDDDITGNHEGEDLARLRAQRATPERLAHLESKYDRLGEQVNAIHVDVAGMRGELKVLPKLLELLEGKQAAAVEAAKDEQTTKRLGMTTRTQVILGILGLFSAGGIGAIIAALSGCAP